MSYVTRQVDESVFKTDPCIKRLPEPVLTYKDVPYPAGLTFNAGVIKKDGKYIMMFRNDYGDLDAHRLDGTNIGLAYSDDGIKWNVTDKPCFSMKTDEIMRIYDPRITYIDGEYQVCFAVDTKHGVCGGIATTDEKFENFEVKSISVPENRNMVIFPEKINGNYVRLERPMPVYSRDGDIFDIFLSESPDLVYWGKSRLVLGVEDVPFCNTKIGPGAPPIKTEKGWLTLFHSVDFDETRGKNGWEKAWKKRYVIGIMLLDLNDPSKVIGMSKKPLMVPEKQYEIPYAFRKNALFPCGMILEDNREVKIYFGESDAVVALATAKLDDLLALCTEPRK